VTTVTSGRSSGGDEFAGAVAVVTPHRSSTRRTALESRSRLAIEASGLAKSFGETRAVCGVDLAVQSGTVYGFRKLRT
jgi:hypothetical protein